jgi:transcriptional regulator with XRE-family HTH domain
MRDSIPAPAGPEAIAPPPERPAGGVIAATPAQGQLLDAHQLQLRALGAELRQAREARGFSLEALAERLRLGQEQLQALEEGDTRRLPELVFVIAQLRRVAGALQLDLGDQLAQLRCRPPAVSGAPSKPSGPARRVALQRPVAAPASRPAAHPAGAQGRGTPRWRLAAGLAIPVVALTAALEFGLVRRGERHAPVASSAVSNLPSGRGLTPSAPEATPSPSAPSAAAAPAQATTSTTGSATATPTSTETTTATSSPAAANQMSLNLQAAEASWLEVRSGSGVLLFRGFFNGARRFPLQAGLRLLAGRPDLIEVSGASHPARKLGPISAVVWYSFPAPTPSPRASASSQPPQPTLR